MYNRHAMSIDTDGDEDEEENLLAFLGGGLQSSTDSSSDDNEQHTMKRTVRFREKVAEDISAEDVDLDDEDLGDAPDWFLWQPFQHSRKLVLPCVFGAGLPLLLGGDLLLAVITVGALITHLAQEAGSSKNASTVCVLTTICASLVILYNGAPLVIWTSSLYLILLLAAFLYIILTGMWLLVLIKDFCRREPELSYYLESSLFTVYPMSSIVLVTWSVTMVISVQYSPYVLLVTGFLFCRIFLRPTQSSFVKDDYPDDNKKLVIDPTLSAILIGYLVIVPTVMQFIVSVSTGEFESSFLGHLFECVSVFLGSCFLATFLHLGSVINMLGYSMDKIFIMRKVVAMAAIITGTLALHFHGYQSLLLPWWPFIFVCSWALQGAALAWNSKSHSMGLTANLVFLSVLLFGQMPWSLVCQVGHAMWSVQFLYISILMNALLCILVVYASKFTSQDIFSLLVLVQTLVFVSHLSLLYQSTVVSTAFVLLLQSFCVYVLLRMYHVEKLLCQHAVVSSSLHLTLMLTSIIGAQLSRNQSWIFYIANGASVFGLTAILLQVFIVEKSEMIQSRKHIQYLGAICVFSLVCLGLNVDFLPAIILSDISSSIFIITGLSGVITSIPGIKLILWHKTELKLASSLTAVLGVVSLALIVLQPSISTERSDLVRLLVVVVVGSGGTLVAVINRTRSWPVLYTLCGIVGTSTGAVSFLLFYPEVTELSSIYSLVYGTLFSLTLAMGVTVYKQSAKTESNASFIGLLSVVMAILVTAMDIGCHGIKGARTGPGVIVAALSLVLNSALIKLLSFNRLPHISQDTMKKSRLPAIGNAATFVSFLLLCYQEPSASIPQDLWLLGSSSSLLLLRRDDVPILRDLNHRNHITPPVVAISIYLLAYIAYHSLLWGPQKYFSSLLASSLEMSAIVSTIPVVTTLWVVLWFGDFRMVGIFTQRAQALSVLYLGPFFLCFLLAPISTTYHSWAYGVLGLSIVIWLWKTKIPLTLL